MHTTRREKFIFQLAIIFIVCSIFNIISLYSVTAATHYVRQEAIAGGNGLSWLNAFNQIQVAIDAAASGDQVWIKTGSYSPINTITVSEDISIFGSFAGTETVITQRNVAANPTTINGFTDKQTMLLMHPSGIILDGLTFSGSTYSNSALKIELSSSAQITNCSFLNNTNGLEIVYGTVRNCYFSGNKRSIQVSWDEVSDGVITALIEGCIFENNLNDLADTEGWGAGIYLEAFSGAEIDSCVFKGNRAGAGSAIAADSEATAVINDCVFGGEIFAEGNSSTTLGGGAIYGYNNTDIAVSNCSFQQNWVETGLDGGAIYSHDSNLTINGSTFIANTAGAQGGAVFSENDVTTITNSLFINNSAAIGGGFAGNGLIENTLFNGNTATTGHGGGAFIAREEVQSNIVHCVFYNNEAGSYGGAVSSNYNFTATSVIFLNNSAANNYADIYNFNGYTPSISNSRLRQDPYAESRKNISELPQFVDVDNNDFHLLQTSPCIDAGRLTPATGLPPNDPDGNTRPADGDYDGEALPDIGIYELLPPGDIDSNGLIELADVIKTLQIVTGTADLAITPVADVNGDNRIGLEDAIYALGILVETSKIYPIGPEIEGSNWVGTLDLQKEGFQGQQRVTAVITQVGDRITITTSSSLLYGKIFKGTITSKGYITVLDWITSKTWTTHFGEASSNTIQLFDYVNDFLDFDTLFLVRETK